MNPNDIEIIRDYVKKQLEQEHSDVTERDVDAMTDILIAFLDEQIIDNNITDLLRINYQNLRKMYRRYSEGNRKLD